MKTDTRNTRGRFPAWTLWAAIVAVAASSLVIGVAEVRAQEAAPEPEFKPGIPGLMMEDVRDLRFLWREIDQLHQWETGERITVAEFRSKSIEKTVHYLQLSGSEASEFTTTASDAVAAVRESFHERRRVDDGPGAGTRFSADLRAAVTSVQSALADAPRHQLFEPDTKKWLLRLAFGPTERKEARESQQVGSPR